MSAKVDSSSKKSLSEHGVLYQGLGLVNTNTNGGSRERILAMLIRLNQDPDSAEVINPATNNCEATGDAD